MLSCYKMINERLIHLQGSRVYLMNFCFCSPCNWNREQKRMKASPFWHYWNWWLVIGGASLYTATLFQRIYINTIIVFGKSLEEEKVFLMSKSGKNILASLIYLTVDALAFGFIVNALGFAIMIANRRQMLWRVNNSIIDTNIWMLNKLELHNGYRPSGENTSRDASRKAEIILLMLNTGSIVLPILYGLAILHHYEPVHRSLTEWLETRPRLTFYFLPIMLMVDWGLIFCGNVVYLPVSMCVLYIELCRFWIPGIAPQSIVIFQGKPRYSSQVGLIDGTLITKFYRCQQVINVAVNEQMKSGWVSMHHGLVVIIFVLSTYLCIHYTEDVQSMGMAGLILPAAAFCAMLIEYHETHLLGNILNESREFIKIGRKVSAPKSELRKFFASCQDMKLQTAYPFFVVSYDTFLLILNQSIDFLVSLLVFG